MPGQLPSPPAARSRRRIWIALGIAGLLLALCCTGSALSSLTTR
ncbi:hypothetical protein [Hamadaea tsunoensis]|nr:hypothetical protein [Hamadaea tsunoensis]